MLSNLKEAIYTCTFCHPKTWGGDNTMGTLIKDLVWQILVLIYDVIQEGLEFSQYDISKLWCR